MNTNNRITAMDKKVLLSTIWLFALFNYLYCDVLTLMNSEILKQYMTGKVNGMQINQGFLLGASILMEIPIAMVLLSRILKNRANRWANIIAGAIMTIVQFMALVATPPTLYGIFFSIIEITSTALIVWFAWNWRNPES
jgi:MFS family permease